jgi:peroxiredoxin
MVMIRTSRPFVSAAALALVCACAPPPIVNTRLTFPPLPGTDGAIHDLAPGRETRLTVLFFFADHCPCQAAHDARLRDLYTLYHPRGVDILGVDSELGANPERDRAEAIKRGYPFPILIDHGGALAHRVGAQYATEAIVVDAVGDIRYHGGIDSDKRTLHDDATPFLREALDDLLAAAPVRRTETEALGCALQTW